MEQNVFYNKLSELVLRVQEEYDRTNALWDALSESGGHSRPNMGKIRVKHYSDTPDLHDQTEAYRIFIYKMMDREFLTPLSEETFSLSYRVKTIDSILDKIERYDTNPRLLGNTPVNKCLNDVCGVRLIAKHAVSTNEIVKYMGDDHPELKILDSSKMKDGMVRYIATHIYFKESNYHYPWELQIWSEEDSEMNFKSHKEHKEAYVNWNRKDTDTP